MDEEAWHNARAKSLMVFLNGSAIPAPDPRGNRVLDDSFLVMFNGHHEPIEFTLPDHEWAAAWEVVLNTVKPAAHAITLDDPSEQYKAGDRVDVAPRSVVLLREAE